MNMLGSYIPSDSFLHRQDDTIRLLSFILLFILIATSEGIVGYIVSFAVILIVYRMGKLSLMNTLRSMRRFNAFFITVFVMNAFFFFFDDPIFSFWFIVFSLRGIILGFDMVLRVIFAVFLSAALTASSTPIAITDGIRTLLHPLSYLHIPVDEAASVLSIAISLIPIIAGESREIILSERARGVIPEDNSKAKARALSVAPLIIPLFLAAFRRAENLGTAMEARGYQSGGKSRRRIRLSVGKNEIMFIAFSISSLFISLFVKEIII